MSEFFIVVDKLEDWAPYHPSQDVITFDDYLQRARESDHRRVRVINLCRRFSYLSTGYYCSLLAEARNHHALPSIHTLSDLGRKSLAVLQFQGLDKPLSKLPQATDGETRSFRCWFGQCLDPLYAALARKVFERFPCPILQISLEFRRTWRIKAIKPVSLNDLDQVEEQDSFATTFEQYSARMWRKPKARKTYRYDLAILVNPDETLPPSDKKALKQFVRAANQLGIAAEFISKKDYIRLPEYDGLFIRETTGVNHHTYRFARKAETEDMVVIDDPTSILRCTNKIYLADLLQTNKVPTPRTEIFSNTSESTLQKVIDNINFPIVLKIPDGSFSRGVVKVENSQELKLHARELIQNSSLLLAQEYIYTEYDWRIGILNRRPLYACRYYMVRNHWQIYQHNEKQLKGGDFDTLPIDAVPEKVLDAALRATQLIGDGFYGVDIKESGERVVVIEVNDNPSIDSGVEDRHLGQQLYLEIMQEFLRRMAARRH